MTSIKVSDKHPKPEDFEPSAAGIRLKEIAKQVGVSSAYLSQIRHGVRPMSAKIKQKLSEVVSEDSRWWAIVDNTQNF